MTAAFDANIALDDGFDADLFSPVKSVADGGEFKSVAGAGADSDGLAAKYVRNFQLA